MKISSYKKLQQVHVFTVITVPDAITTRNIHFTNFCKMIQEKSWKDKRFIVYITITNQ